MNEIDEILVLYHAYCESMGRTGNDRQTTKELLAELIETRKRIVNPDNVLASSASYNQAISDVVKLLKGGE